MREYVFANEKICNFYSVPSECGVDVARIYAEGVDEFRAEKRGGRLKMGGTSSTGIVKAEPGSQ